MKNACCTLLCAVSLAATSSGVLAADVTVDSSTLFGIGRRDVSGASFSFSGRDFLRASHGTIAAKECAAGTDRPDHDPARRRDTGHGPAAAACIRP